jgi:two-component system, response regulator PdtaR
MMSKQNSHTGILIVEDEAILAMNLQDKLVELGYHVLATVEAGEVAIQMVELLQPDLVLMDIKLKDGMDGVEAARQIRSKHAVPIIFMTAYGDDQTRQRALAACPNGFLMKPFRNSQLSTILVSVLHSPAM